MRHCGCLEHNERTYPAAIEPIEAVWQDHCHLSRPAPVRVNIAFKLTENHLGAVIFWLSPSEHIFKMQTGTQLVKIVAQESSLLYKRNKNV